MKKNTKLFLWFFVIALAIVGVYYFAVSQSVGFSTLSLGQVSFNSNDPTVGGQAWLLTVSQNGAGQSASGTFKATSGSSESSQFTINTKLEQNYVLYNIQNTNIPIQKVEYTSTGYNPFGSLKGCNPDYWDNAFIEGGLFSKVWCYKFTTDGFYGSISSGNVNFESTINVVGVGGTDSCKISNTGSTSCTSNKGDFYVSWAGSLVSGQSIPNPSNDNKIAVYKPSVNGWQIGSKLAYDNYKSYNLNSCLNLPVNNDFQGCFKKYNSYSNAVLIPSSWSIVGGSNAITLGSQSNGQIKMNLPTQVQFPVLTMRIKASLIGINIPVGDPSITSVSSLEFQTGQTGTIQVSVKNVGTGDGSFDVFATCTNGFTQSGNALRISGLSKGASQTVYLPITANVQSGTSSGTCTVTAKDVNNPSNVDTRSVTVKASQIAICTPGDQRISGQNIQECISNVWTTIESCPEGETPDFVSGSLQCVDDRTSSESCQWYDVGCQVNKITKTIGDFFKGVFDFLGIVLLLLSIITFFVVYLTSQQVLNKWFKKEKVIVVIISILAGLVIASIVYKLWYIGLIAVGLYALIKLTPVGVFLK